MNVLIAPNNFKESIDAYSAAQAIEKGFLTANAYNKTKLLPLSDGGEGFVKTMVNALSGEIISCKVNDPLDRAITSYFGKVGNDTAVVEMALASGLELITEEEKNPLLTTSYGTGQLILKAIENGFKKILIGIGGSATNDAGMGMLQALGVEFYDQDNRLITTHGAKELANISRIETSTCKSITEGVQFTVACDVTNPLLGPSGATYVYGPQKGADSTMLLELEKGVSNFHKITSETLAEDFSTYEGAGAAGGMGYALLTYLNASLKPGFSIIAEHTDLQSHIKDADMVITGEGKIDAQTSQGKVISRLSGLCLENKVALIAIGGKIENDIEINGVKKFYEISKLAKDTEDAMRNAADYLEQIGFKIGKSVS